MIKFINEELFKTKTESRELDGASVYSTAVYSTVLSQGVKQDQRLNRLIGIITHDHENYAQDNSKIWVQRTEHDSKVKKVVKISASEKNKSDLPIYFVAIPFNGFLSPIKEDFGYRIWKGVIVKSDRRNISFNGSYYKKVLYLIMVPNELMFKEDHKYHRDSIELVTTSFNIEDDKDNPEVKNTWRETHTITFEKNQFGCKIHKEMVGAINTDDFKGKTLIPIYDPTISNESKADDSKRNPTPNYHRDEKKKVMKDYKPYKDTMKTTKKIKPITITSESSEEVASVTTPESLENKPFQNIDKMIEEFNRKNKVENYKPRQVSKKKKKKRK